MTAAGFILCAWWCASNPTLGAMVAPAGEGALQLGGGVDALFPTLEAAGQLGLGRGIDLGVRYETQLLVHTFAAEARLRLADRLALAVDADWGFFVIDEIAGIRAEDAPFGGGATLGMALWRSWFARGGAHVAGGLGATLRWLEANGELRASFDHVTIEIASEWGGDGGTTYLRFRAVVPIAADFHVIGFLPGVVVGRSWNL